jgi:hypothetical protein
MGSMPPDLPGLPGWPRDPETMPFANAEGYPAAASAPQPPMGLPTRVGSAGALVPVTGRVSAGERRTSAPPVAEVYRGRHTPTLTQQMRRIEPTDVARQAIGELGVLAGELDALPETLTQAGLAGSQGQTYFAATRAYLDLCHRAWEAVAEEQLEQEGAEAPYRQQAVAVARGIVRLREHSARALTSGVTARPPRSLLWRRRVRLVRFGLRAWQAQLAPVPNPLAMGRGLVALRAYVGLASAGGLDLLLWDLLAGTSLALTGLLTLGALLLLVAALATGATSLAAIYATIGLTCALGWALSILLGANGPLPLGLLMGASVYVPGRSVCLGAHASRVVAVLLRIWWLLVGSVAALAVPAALAIGGGLLALAGPLAVPATAVAAVAVAGRTLFVALVVPAAVAVAGLLLLALPFALVAQAHLIRELGGNVQWVPAARRYALRPALAVGVFLTIGLVAAVYGAGTALGWQHVELFSVAFSQVRGALTARGLGLLLALTLPYLLWLELPFRLGMRRWRGQRLADLEQRRAEVESQVRRLTGQEADDDMLRAMQYDLVLLQFYRGKQEEAARTPAAPFRLTGPLSALVAALASALLIDGATGTLAHLLVTSH